LRKLGKGESMKTLLFSKQMACAWAHGDKNQTRRALSLKLQDNLIFSRIGKGDEWIGWFWNIGDEVITPVIKAAYDKSTQKLYKSGSGLRCPYGVTGDKVRLLTTWAVDKSYDHLPNLLLKDVKIWSAFDGFLKPASFGKPRMGRYIPNSLRNQMPCAEITSIDIQRVKDISDKDILGEGILSVPYTQQDKTAEDARRRVFYELFDSLNKGKGVSTQQNSWVWVIGLKKSTNGRK